MRQNYATFILLFVTSRLIKCKDGSRCISRPVNSFGSVSHPHLEREAI